MDINKSSKIFYVLVFISFNVMSDHFNDDNTCFYSSDNYLEKSDSKKFCVPSYTEDEWLFSQWNNNISSIKVPLNIQVDVFSDFSFTGKSKSLYQDTNAADLINYGLMSDISSYRVLPKKLYPDNKRIHFNYHSELFSEKYVGYNYYLSRGHSIILTREEQPRDIDGQSSSIFYSHAGQIMSAFSGQGFDRNLYCLHVADLRKGKQSADVAFSYCDFSNPGQRWFPEKIEAKFALVNQGTGTPLLLDDDGFYVYLNAKDSSINQYPIRELDYYQLLTRIDTVWFDEQYIEKLNSLAVRPFLQYKETLEVLDDLGHHNIISHHLDEIDDINVYLESGGKKRWDIYYNAETQYLLAYNKLSQDRKLAETSCLSLLNNSDEEHLAVYFSYDRSSYSDNSITYHCDNGVAYNMYTHRWNFMADQGYRYLVNGYENKVLHFFTNDKPQRTTYRGTLIGPKPGVLIGKAINFNERKPQDAILTSNQALAYSLDMEKRVCELKNIIDNKDTHCTGTDTSWSSTDYHVQNIHLSRYYIPWLLIRIVYRLYSDEWTDELTAFLQKIEALDTLLEKNKDKPVDSAVLEQTKALLVEFLHTYSSSEYSKIWYQAAHVLNRVEVLIEWGSNSPS
ncbi:hypothetical protein [Yersinia hibernica]|uniref:Acetyltransferase domain-containing protein n=1 Tax=Yersinia enterocolitica LC20 TaxID=1443113 RepID=A0A7U4GH98_YEREN|nr:hypothetical protein [Yersinia hibernica]AHM75329.1 hypothetical protein LC20_04076 [Yersinia hibernica]OVZ90380.1 hypothetical protein CBW54_07750 [Yersinia kristensenii]